MLTLQDYLPQQQRVPVLIVMLISLYLKDLVTVLLQEELEHLLLQLLTMRVLQHISKLRKVQMAVQLTVQLMTTSH